MKARRGFVWPFGFLILITDSHQVPDSQDFVQSGLEYLQGQTSWNSTLEPVVTWYHLNHSPEKHLKVCKLKHFFFLIWFYYLYSSSTVVVTCTDRIRNRKHVWGGKKQQNSIGGVIVIGGEIFKKQELWMGLMLISFLQFFNLSAYFQVNRRLHSLFPCTEVATWSLMGLNLTDTSEDANRSIEDWLLLSSEIYSHVLLLSRSSLFSFYI